MVGDDVLVDEMKSPENSCRGGIRADGAREGRMVGNTETEPGVWPAGDSEMSAFCP